jgi:hypothetical protein
VEFACANPFQEEDGMKTLRLALVPVIASLAFLSCQSLDVAALHTALSSAQSASPAVSSGSVAGASAASFDFQAGELLCSTNSGKMMDSDYYVAQVLTPASPGTKNQAEVVFVENGTKSWANYEINSRKAVKEDFAVGATVLFISGWSNHDDVSANTYRKGCWRLGNITSVEDLYKNRIEVNGASFNINYLRVPTDPIK